MSVRITTERKDHVFHIGLNRPDKYNAFDVQMLHELANAYTEYEEDNQLWCAVLYAHGEHFTSGLDLADVGPAFAAGDDLFPADRVDPLGLLGRKRTKPVVQVVQGYCLTIGMELAMASDILVAASDTTFGQIEVKRGIMPFGGATVRFPQRCGWGNAMRYLLTGDRFDAGEALRIGFVQEVADDRDSALERGVSIANTIARQAPLAVSASLVNARVSIEEGDAAALAGLLEEARRLMTTEDAQEGLQSFLERRDAHFTGK
jgi:enoyl-CoA hydratase/carnithine racemase